MPIPKAVARVNRKLTNPILLPVARRLPGFAVVTHVGRRTGTAYRTPVNVFRHGERWVIALTYGADSQWVRNALAAGEIRIETRRRQLLLVAPEVVHDPSRTMIPPPARWILGLLHVDDVLVLRAGGAAP
jgi:deazaflavin-dependent oxidoreductase (nitroreductase family)